MKGVRRQRHPREGNKRVVGAGGRKILIRSAFTLYLASQIM